MEWIHKNTIYKPVVVYAGSKIMIMKIKELKMTFVDSLNFLTMPLSNFPKTFGIKELKKGFFPHYFNIKKNYKYIGKVPSRGHSYPTNYLARVAGRFEFRPFLAVLAGVSTHQKSEKAEK